MEYSYSQWFDYKRADFKFEDRDALIVFPNVKPNGKWAVKMEYFGAFPDFEVELISRGWHLAYLKNHNRWGTDDDSDAKARFCHFISAEFGLEDKFACVGMSCGGICSVNFASRYPELVSFLDLDAPVMNMLSCPCGFGRGEALGTNNSAWGEIVDAYGFTPSSILTYREHPIDRLPVLGEHRIPAALLYGDEDTVVPYEENGLVMEKYYKSLGIPLYVECRPGCGHHPHGPADTKVLADFVESHT